MTPLTSLQLGQQPHLPPQTMNVEPRSELPSTSNLHRRTSVNGCCATSVQGDCRREVCGWPLDPYPALLMAFQAKAAPACSTVPSPMPSSLFPHVSCSAIHVGILFGLKGMKPLGQKAQKADCFYHPQCTCAAMQNFTQCATVPRNINVEDATALRKGIVDPLSAHTAMLLPRGHRRRRCQMDGTRLPMAIEKSQLPCQVAQVRE